MLRQLEKNVIAFGGSHKENVVELVAHFSKNIDNILKEKIQPVTLDSSYDGDYFSESFDNSTSITLADKAFSSWFKFVSKPNLLIPSSLQGSPFALGCGEEIVLIPSSKGIYSLSVIASPSVGQHSLKGKTVKTPLCRGWHIGKRGFPVMLSSESKKLKSLNCEFCPHFDTDCKKSSYRVVFVSGFMPVADGEDYPENFMCTGKDFSLPLKSELKETYIYVTIMGILESRGAWGYNLFQKTKLKSRFLCECQISAFAKQAEQSYCMVDCTEENPEPINIENSLLQKIFTALVRPLQNRAVKLKIGIENRNNTYELQKNKAKSLKTGDDGDSDGDGDMDNSEEDSGNVFGNPPF